MITTIRVLHFKMAEQVADAFWRWSEEGVFACSGFGTPLLIVVADSYHGTPEGVHAAVTARRLLCADLPHLTDT